MKKLLCISIVFILVVFSVSCAPINENPQLQKVGMLIEGSIDEKPWNKKGYHGLLEINKQFDVDIYFKEGIQTKNQIINAVDEFVKNGANLIFGHGHIYGRFFSQIAEEYPKVHFVYFNGGYIGDNVTSINFASLAMGFFSGMLAGKMSKSKQVGVIAAYEWQSEIEGFYEGVKFQEPNTKVHINFINDWNNEQLALKIYDQMRNKDVDVVYPAGDYFSETIIKKASADNIYAIGYFEDQQHIDPSTVLTSTVQHVDKLYTYIAHQFNEQQLKGGFLTFDFQESFISLGNFSDQIPKDFLQLLLDYVDKYIETNLLPHEQ